MPRTLLICNTVCLRAFGKRIVLIIDVKQIRSQLRLVIIKFAANINILKTIIIYISDRHTGRPASVKINSCFFGYFFKFKIAHIEIKLIRNQVAYKEQIFESIIIDVNYSYSTTAIKIGIDQNIGCLRIIQCVYKINLCG